MLGSPREFQTETATLDQTRVFLDKAAALIQKNGLDANNLLYRLAASEDYDPAPDLSWAEAAVLSINFAEDAINPTELGLIDRAKSSLPNGKFILVPASQQTIGHQTLGKATVLPRIRG